MFRRAFVFFLPLVLANIADGKFFDTQHSNYNANSNNNKLIGGGYNGATREPERERPIIREAPYKYGTGVTTDNDRNHRYVYVVPPHRMYRDKTDGDAANMLPEEGVDDHAMYEIDESAGDAEDSGKRDRKWWGLKNVPLDFWGTVLVPPGYEDTLRLPAGWEGRVLNAKDFEGGLLIPTGYKGEDRWSYAVDYTPHKQCNPDELVIDHSPRYIDDKEARCEVLGDDGGSPEGVVIFNNNYNVLFKGNRKFDREHFGSGPSSRRNRGLFADRIPPIRRPDGRLLYGTTLPLIIPRPRGTEDGDRMTPSYMGTNVNSNANYNYLSKRRSNTNANVNTNTNANQNQHGGYAPGRTGGGYRVKPLGPMVYKPMFEDDDDVEDDSHDDSEGGGHLGGSAANSNVNSNSNVNVADYQLPRQARASPTRKFFFWPFLPWRPKSDNAGWRPMSELNNWFGGMGGNIYGGMSPEGFSIRGGIKGELHGLYR